VGSGRPADGTRTAPPGEGPADGRRYAAVPVRYTCWLYDPSAAGGAPERLFEAACGHPGYVAAGLAVAWHPDGRRLDFVDRSGPGRHQVRTFDLTARRSEPVPLPSAEHVCLGSATGQRHRSVLLGGAAGQSGLWVEGEAGGWWRVPDSEPEAAHLEELRRRLPRWSRDGRKLAFVAGTALRVCDTATRRTDQWLDAGDSPASAGLWWGDPHPSASLHWHPDGSRIGLVRGSRLGLVGPAGWLGELTDSPVVSFAGWDAGGRWAAYVTAEPLPYAADPPDSQAGPSDLLPAIAGAPWATLFVPNPAARSAVRFADADGKNPRVAVSGLRATFPHWSPTEPRLSVWLTVEPPYRLAAGGRFGMPPGDPAAVLDPDTGALDWLPVSGTETPRSDTPNCGPAGSPPPSTGSTRPRPGCPRAGRRTGCSSGRSRCRGRAGTPRRGTPGRGSSPPGSGRRTAPGT